MGIYSVMSSIQYTRIALNYGNGDTGEKPDLFRVSYKPTKGLPETTINDRTKAEAADEQDTVKREKKSVRNSQRIIFELSFIIRFSCCCLSPATLCPFIQAIFNVNTSASPHMQTRVFRIETIGGEKNILNKEKEN